MNSDGKFFLGVVVAAILVIGGIIFFSHKKTTVQSGDTVTVDTTIGEKLGPDEAKVKIVEFGDFQCPACAAAAADFHSAQEKNKTDVQIIYRYFPLTTIHPNAETGALAGRAAANQGKFWEMDALLYQTQKDWASQSDPRNYFYNLADQLGLNRTQFISDMTTDSTKKIVQTDMDYGDSLSVDQTPTFFVNGKRVTGAQSVDAWQKLIDQAKSQ